MTSQVANCFPALKLISHNYSVVPRSRSRRNRPANSGEKPQTDDQTVIAIAANKGIYLKAKPINETELASKVNEILETKLKKEVLISADQDVDYGTVMGVMDQLHQAGIEDIGLITEPRKGAGGSAGGQ